MTDKQIAIYREANNLILILLQLLHVGSERGILKGERIAKNSANTFIFGIT